MKNWQIIFYSLVLLAAASVAYPQAELLFDPTNPEGPIVVKAERAIFERGSGVTKFVGNVVVTHADLRLTCDSAEVLLDENHDNQIALVRVEGNINLVNKDAKATASQGVYSLEDNRIRLIGGVRIETPAFTLSGPVFVYDIETGQGVLEEGGAADVQVKNQ